MHTTPGCAYLMRGQISGILEHRFSGVMKVHSVQLRKPKLGPEQHGKLD